MHPQNGFCQRTSPSLIWICLLVLVLCSPANAQRGGSASSGLSVVPDRARPQTQAAAQILRTDKCDTTKPGTCPGTFTFSYAFAANASPRHGGPEVERLGLSFSVYLTRRLFALVENDNLISVKNDSAPRETGFGDTTVYAGYDALLPGRGRPGITLLYGIKAPTASAKKGLGSGDVDHVVLGAVGKPFGKNYVEFDLGDYIAGSNDGYDSFPFAAGIFERELHPKFNLHTEFGGEFATNESNATLYNLSFLQSRLSDHAALRTGVRVGLTPNSPRVGVYLAVRFGGILN